MEAPRTDWEASCHEKQTSDTISLLTQRALFLNGDDLESAKTWLEGQKSGGSAAPGHLTATIATNSAESDSGEQIPPSLGCSSDTIFCPESFKFPVNMDIWMRHPCRRIGHGRCIAAVHDWQRNPESARSSGLDCSKHAGDFCLLLLHLPTVQLPAGHPTPTTY